MNAVALFGTRVVHRFFNFTLICRKLCHFSYDCDRSDEGFQYIEEPLNRICRSLSWDSGEDDIHRREHLSGRQKFFANVRVDAARVLDILRRDGPGFDAKEALSQLCLRVSVLLVREVLVGILRNINHENKTRCAKLGCKFFVWSGLQDNYKHTANSYHLIMQISAECGEYKDMWILLNKMIQDGIAPTARTFNIFICTCGEAGLGRNVVERTVVERFIKSKTFNCRPFKHPYNAILHALLAVRHYKLIEWVYQEMLSKHHSPDILTYNIVMCAKYRLGKLDQFHGLLNEMDRSGHCPDIHTYNILLHVLGKGDKPLAALDLLNHMKEVGVDPSVLHFTTLLDGLSRAGNLDACEYFFNEMINNRCMPDVVCYTVMITGYVVAGELEKALEMFDEMTINGHLPNVFTYNSMIRGFCMAGKFDEACSMLKEMESRGCNPNFLVYKTLVNNLRNAGKLAEAHKIIRRMMKKGHYVHLLPKFKGYKRN